MEYQQESEEREKKQQALTENQRVPEDHDTDSIH